jgi:hypothetical protein
VSELVQQHAQLCPLPFRRSVTSTHKPRDPLTAPVLLPRNSLVKL